MSFLSVDNSSESGGIIFFGLSKCLGTDFIGFALYFLDQSTKEIMSFNPRHTDFRCRHCFDPSSFETLAYNIGKRGWIWQTAIEGIKHHPLLGQGPFTYMFSYQQYQGPYTQHAHSLYLEPLLSYGIILTGVFLTYMVSNIKQCFHLYHQDRHLFSLVFSFMMVVICHGVFDYTIFWIQTILLFFIVLASGDLKGVKVVQVDA